MHKYPTHQYDKIGVAREQIEVAIRLFAGGGCRASVHTLGSAAGQILKGLRNAAGETFFIDLVDRAKSEHIKEVAKHANAAANFFKHADRDPGAVFRFDEKINDFLLFSCVYGFQRLAGEMTPVMRVYVNWFFLMQPDILYECDIKDMIEDFIAGNSEHAELTREERVNILELALQKI